MSLVCDIQSKLAIKSIADMSIVAGANSGVNSDAIDTKEYQSMTVALKTSRALTSSDVLTYKFQQSDNGTDGWTDVPVDGHLPNRKNPDRTLEIAQNGQLQDVGCFSSDRYVRLVIAGTGDSGGVTISPIIAFESMVMEDAGYSSEKIPNDGQP